MSKTKSEPSPTPTPSNHDQMAELLNKVVISDTHLLAERQRILGEYEADKKAEAKKK